MTPEVYSISPILKADLVALLRAALGADAVGVIFVVGGFQRVDLLVRAAGGAFVVGIAIFLIVIPLNVIYPFCSLSISRSFKNSSGRGDSKVILSPVRGCVRVSLLAWSA